jgi:archaemetzincin
MTPMGFPTRRDVLAGLATLLVGCDDARGEPSPAPRSSAAPSPSPPSSATVSDPLAHFEALKDVREKLRPLHVRPGKPKPGEWRAEHPEERGQTFEQYIASRPTVPDRGRRIVFVQPLGDFKPTDRRIVQRASEYLALHFRLETKILPDVPLSAVPASARRKHPQWGDAQVLTTYVLNEMLAPRLPREAAALIAFTPSDLWPGQGWNFVFGQADLRARVGVWSLYRNGNADASPEAFKLALLRALRIAVHETGHMFSLEHCTAYKCVQAGVNSLDEADQSPLWLCPECEVKVAWATSSEPKERIRGMRDFCRTQSLAREAEFFDKELAALA